MPLTDSMSALRFLPPELEKQFGFVHESRLEKILPIAGPAIGVMVIAFALWKVFAYAAGAEHALLLATLSVGLAAIGFRQTALRWSPTLRAGYLYWVYASTLILLAFSSGQYSQGGMAVIATTAFLISGMAVRPGIFLWMASGPFLLFMAVAMRDVTPAEYVDRLASYGLAIVLALLMMFGLRLVRQKAFLLELQLGRTVQRDHLTGLLNQNAISELAAREFMRARRHQRPFAVAMVDIDCFKQINNEFGEQIGNAIIKAFADACSAQLREIDLLGRIGGDEFVCLLPEAAGGDAFACAERLRACIQRMVVDTAKGPARFTVSIGVAALGDEHLSWESLMRAADAALYQAKCEGRNRVATAWPRRESAAPRNANEVA